MTRATEDSRAHRYQLGESARSAANRSAPDGAHAEPPRTLSACSKWTRPDSWGRKFTSDEPSAQSRVTLTPGLSRIPDCSRTPDLNRASGKARLRERDPSQNAKA